MHTVVFVFHETLTVSCGVDNEHQAHMIAGCSINFFDRGPRPILFCLSQAAVHRTTL